MEKPADLVSLASIVPPANHEVSGGFNAIVDGKQVRVRAVLERTVVIEHHEGGERSVVRKDAILVKPSAAVRARQPQQRSRPTAVAPAAGQAPGDPAPGPVRRSLPTVWGGQVGRSNVSSRHGCPDPPT